MGDIHSIRHKLDQQKGMRSQIERTMEKTSQTIKDKKRDLRRHEQAREIIREVGLKTQQQLELHISDITTMALEAVFDDPYKLIVEFVQRRNKTECDLFFERGGYRMNPLFASGGGPRDVAAFSLRVGSWSMQNPRSRNTLILDEPFIGLKGEEANRKVLKMVKEVSEELNIQIIMVSDERIPKEDIIEISDKVFEVSKYKGISNVVAET
jgi:hypothetical protein